MNIIKMFLLLSFLAVFSNSVPLGKFAEDYDEDVQSEQESNSEIFEEERTELEIFEEEIAKLNCSSLIYAKKIINDKIDSSLVKEKQKGFKKAELIINFYIVEKECLLDD